MLLAEGFSISVDAFGAWLAGALVLIFCLERCAALWVHCRILFGREDQKDLERAESRWQRKFEHGDHLVSRLARRVAVMHKQLNNGISDKIDKISDWVDDTAPRIERMSVLIEQHMGNQK